MKISIVISLLLLGSVAAHAQILAVNFNYDTARRGGTLDSTSTAGAPGVVTDNWNNVGGADDWTTGEGTFIWTNPNLVDGNGVASGVSLTASTTYDTASDGLWGQGGGGSSASGDANLFSGGLQVRGATVTFSLTNLDSEYGTGPYDLYVYFSEGSSVGGGNGTSVTVSNGTVSETISPTGYTGAYVDGTDGTGDYILFTGLSGDTQTFTVAASVPFSNPETNVAGIEIVAVPEPASLLLIGLGCLALAGLRRRMA